jgi:hypothetical protein
MPALAAVLAPQRQQRPKPVSSGDQGIEVERASRWQCVHVAVTRTLAAMGPATVAGLISSSVRRLMGRR